MSVLSVYNSLDLEIDHGDGVYIYSTDGTRYLDFTSGIGVTSLGHSHPALISAFKEQADKIYRNAPKGSDSGRLKELENQVKNLEYVTIAEGSIVN